MDSDSALTISHMRKVACEIGVLLDTATRNKQLSAAARLASAREDVFAAVHCYNPKNDESQITLFNREGPSNQ
jgi:hypothetical protein